MDHIMIKTSSCHPLLTYELDSLYYVEYLLFNGGIIILVLGYFKRIILLIEYSWKAFTQLVAIVADVYCDSQDSTLLQVASVTQHYSSS